MTRRTSVLDWFTRLPILWGGVTCALFYYFLSVGLIEHPVLDRFLASHPIQYIATVLFTVALAALAIRFVTVLFEFGTLDSRLLGPIPAGGQAVSTAAGLLEELRRLPASLQASHFGRRVRAAVNFVRRKDNAEDLEMYLRQLEEADLKNLHSGYALIRVILGAIVTLGAMGTVLGIAVAVASVSPEAWEDSLTTAIAGLGAAFDTTVAALTFAMVLMFVKHGVQRVEERLLNVVTVRTADELIGRFQVAGSASDPQVAAVRRMTEQVVVAVESLATRQVELWKSSIEQTHEQWAQVTNAAGQVLEEAFSTAMDANINRHAEKLNEGVREHAEHLAQTTQATMDQVQQGLERWAELLIEGLEKHGRTLTEAERELAQENRRHLVEVEAAWGEAIAVAADRQEQLAQQGEALLQEMQATSSEMTRNAAGQQEQLIKQGEILLRVVEATGQVKKLEDALNQNLAALVQTCNFDEGMLNLSAAIQLLSARLGHPASRSGALNAAREPAKYYAA